MHTFSIEPYLNTATVVSCSGPGQVKNDNTLKYVNQIFLFLFFAILYAIFCFGDSQKNEAMQHFDLFEHYATTSSTAAAAVEHNMFRLTS